MSSLLSQMSSLPPRLYQRAATFSSQLSPRSSSLNTIWYHISSPSFLRCSYYYAPVLRHYVFQYRRLICRHVHLLIRLLVHRHGLPYSAILLSSQLIWLLPFFHYYTLAIPLHICLMLSLLIMYIEMRQRERLLVTLRCCPEALPHDTTSFYFILWERRRRRKVAWHMSENILVIRAHHMAYSLLRPFTLNRE